MRSDDEVVFKFKKGMQIELIRRAIEKAGSERKLSYLLKIPRRTIRSYKVEKDIIPTERLNTVLIFLGLNFRDVSDLIGTRLPKNWGSKKGGKTSIGMLSKKELKNKLEYVRSFRKNIIQNPDFKLNSALFEFYGILMGDGCISRYSDYKNIKRCDTIITGDKRYEHEYYLYIKSLLKRNFGICGYIYRYKKNNCIKMTIRNKAFAQFLLDLGFPQGSKYKNLIIPSKFLRSNWKKLKYLIRGLFDTDGCIFAKKNEGYRYPYINISIKSNRLRQTLYDILRRRGYPVYFNNQNLFMKGIQNVKRWMGDIGSSNSKHKFKYKYWLKHGKLPAGLMGQ